MKKTSFYRVFIYFIILIFIVLCLAICLPFSRESNQADVMSHADTVLIVIDSANENIADFFAAPSVATFYRTRGFLPFWIKNNELTALGDSMIYFIKQSRMYGLLPQDYHLSEIQTLIDTATNCLQPQCISRLDLLLTNSFFSIASHVQDGRISSETLERLPVQRHIDSAHINLLQNDLLQKGLSKTISSLEPSYLQYRQLRNALRKLLNNADTIQRPLLFSGIVVDSSEIFDKIITLEVNMERWRWESSMKGRYIAVNVPAYMLHVIEADTLVLESKIIVGNEKNQTPMLDSQVKSFTIYPYWNVTRSIAVNEILPKIKTDSLYLQQHHYEVLDIKGNLLDASAIDWQKYHTDNFPFMLRQREGTHNSLGLVKFYFANQYSVYLHDTNSRMLFNRKKRAFSHGCVRVEKALELGRYLVRDDKIYCSPDDLDQYLEMKKQLTVPVVNRIPVHFRYFTCEYREGEIQYYHDIYGYDEKLKKELYNQPIFTDEPLLLSGLAEKKP